MPEWKAHESHEYTFVAHRVKRPRACPPAGKYSQAGYLPLGCLGIGLGARLFCRSAISIRTSSNDIDSHRGRHHPCAPQNLVNLSKSLRAGVNQGDVSLNQ